MLVLWVFYFKRNLWCRFRKGPFSLLLEEKRDCKVEQWVRWTLPIFLSAFREEQRQTKRMQESPTGALHRKNPTTQSGVTLLKQRLGTVSSLSRVWFTQPGSLSPATALFYGISVNTSTSSLKVAINTKNEPHFVNTVITSIAIVFVITFIYQMCY